MTHRTRPPFRADHVGSFLRPKRLLEAREKRQKGEISKEALRAVEDDAIAEIVRFQEDVGLQSITDGEFRRTYFHIDFLEQLGGVKTDIPVTIQKPDGTQELAPAGDARDRQGAPRQGHPARRLRVPEVEGQRRPDAEGDDPVADDAALPRRPRRHQQASTTPTSSRSTRTSPTPTATSCARCSQAGCTYVQMDDTNLAYLCDDKMREAARSRGDDPDELPHRYASFINRVVAQKPDGMTLAVHLCRGNFKSTWAAQGGYEPVAEALLSEMGVDGYFLEYDDARSGDFKPLRFLPKGKIVVLGLVTTKLGQLESKDDIKRRIDEAAKYVPLDQLCLSPQCGFSSTVHGNDIAVEAQRAKLRLIVEVAQDVWG